jgi:chemotaxis protein CheX
MDVKYINPFINSVVNTMETMLGISPQRMAPFLKDTNHANGDVSGIIGFASQEVIGSVAITFPTATALNVYQKMMGEVLSSLNEEVQDTVGELANIVAGGAKGEFAGIGISYHISIPTVVVGKNHTITHKGGTPVVAIPFKLEKDPFFMEISMKLKQ